MRCDFPPARYDVHLMFSLCHGKLCEETARLALARQMMKVRLESCDVR